MLTDQNMTMNDETIIGLKTTRTDVHEYGGVNKVPITIELLEFTDKS